MPILTQETLHRVTTAIFRAYNNRFAFNDSNHRYMTSITLYNQMLAMGWSGEGVVMCAPG